MSKGRTIVQVRDIGDISFVFPAVEDIYVVIFHDLSLHEALGSGAKRS